jgi:hypothetical protein
MASTWFDRRWEVASSRAVSLASLPEVVKKTRASAMPDSPAINSANSIMGSDRYSVEVCSTWSACTRRAAVTSGWAWPIIVVSTPPKKSR